MSVDDESHHTNQLFQVETNPHIEEEPNDASEEKMELRNNRKTHPIFDDISVITCKEIFI